MMILEGRKLGYRFYVLEDKQDAPACRVADGCFRSSEVEKFVSRCDVITYEFEHIQDDILKKAEKKLVPSPEALLIKRSRVEEKRFLRDNRFPVPRFVVAKREELKEAVRSVGLPAVLKAERLGYDGKGQYRVMSEEDVKRVEENHLPGERFVVEEFVPFVAEFSVIGVRDSSGRVLFYPQPFNKHEEGILIYNYVPAYNLREAEEICGRLMSLLNFVGTMAVEFFLLPSGEILVNEFAPRVHNTGHWTLDGADTSQFENHLRAITSLPLGSTRMKSPSGMVNLIGVELGDIPLEKILQIEGTKLYWYGKRKRPKRKVGHINVCAPTKDELLLRLSELLNLIGVSKEALPKA